MFHLQLSGFALVSVFSMALAPALAQESAADRTRTPGATAVMEPADGQQEPTTRCGVYSVFVVSALCARPIPLSQCAEVIPIRPSGTTMAEIKSGLERLGFYADGYALRQGAMKQQEGSWIVWIPPGLEYQTPSGRRFLTGHFVVLHKEKGLGWLLLDYPASGERVDGELWLAQVLSEHGVDEIPALRVRVNPKPLDVQDVGAEAPLGRSAAPIAIGETVGQPGPTANHPVETLPQHDPSDTERSIAELAVSDLSSPLVSTVLDFGNRCEGEQLYGVVALWNGTDRALSLEGVSSTCGCTVPALEDWTLEPGGSVELDVAMSLSGRTGTVRQSVSCVAVAGDHRVPIFVACIAESAQQWTSEPRSAGFGVVRRSDAPVTMPVTVRAAFPSRTSPLVRTESAKHGLNAVIDDKGSDVEHGIYRVLVTLEPSALEPGFFAGNVQLFARDRGPYAEVVLPVTAHVQ